MTNTAYSPISATQIFSSLIPVKPSGEIAEEDTICYLCGHDIHAGEVFRKKLEMKPSFVSWGWIKRHAQSTHVCSSCVNVLNVKFMRECSSVLITENGVYRLNSSSDIAALVLTPPSGNFSAWISTKKMQHMSWRAEVSSDQDMFSILFDDETLIVRREMALRGYAAWRTCEGYLKECGTKATLGPTSVKLLGMGLGGLFGNSRSIIEAGSNTRPDLRDALNVFDSLGMGEWLGVYAMLNTKMADTPSPDEKCINLKDKMTWPTPRPLPQEVMHELALAAGTVDDE